MEFRSSRRRGFTLVELLVALSLVAIGASLVAPGILHARSQARTQVCKNNLKQIALAMHNYHDTYVTFPPGWVAKNTAPETGPCFGWGAFLLPFVDHAPLYNNLNFSKSPDATNALLQTPLPVYRCPDDTLGDLNAVRDEFGTSNYSANYGDAALPGSVAAATKVDGICYWSSRVRIADITDGTSNTFLVGERCVASAGAIWMGVRSNQNAGDNVTACNHEARLNTVIDSFSSRHGDGALFVLCDGAVRFVNDNIDSRPGTKTPKGTYQKLANRHDGEAVGDF